LEVDADQRRQQELIAGAGEVLSMFLGGRRRTRSLSGIASRRSQTRRTRERLRSAEEKLEDYEEAIQDLEEELAEELEEIWEKWKDTAGDLGSFEVGLEKTDIHLDDLFLFWAPVG
jgi:chromosome segregation ATPase